jgi:hypothetical protein
MSMPISDDMAIDPIGDAFRAFGPPTTPVPASTQAQTTQSAPQAQSAQLQLPSQSTVDAIKQALAMMTANSTGDTSVDGTDSSTANDPLAAILSSTDSSSQTAQDPGSLGLDAFA